MAIKAILTSLDGLPDALKAEYKAGADGSYYLDIEGLDTGKHPAVGALVRAKEHEVEERKKIASSRAALQAEHEALQTEHEAKLRSKTPESEVAALEKSWQAKVTKAEAEKAAAVAALSTNLHRLLVDNEAQRIATEIARDPKVIPLILPHVQRRLAVAEDGATTRVLDADGKPSASTVKELAQEFLANPSFADVVIGSRASGGGANGANNGGGAPTIKDASAASPKDLAAAIKARKAQHR